MTIRAKLAQPLSWMWRARQWLLVGACAIRIRGGRCRDEGDAERAQAHALRTARGLVAALARSGLVADVEAPLLGGGA